MMSADVNLDKQLMLTCFEKLNQKLVQVDEHGEILFSVTLPCASCSEVDVILVM
jgi:hypothetical protein